MSTAMQTWTKEAIRGRLAQSDLWLERAILAIYAKQTAAEQCSDQTIEDNGMGFNGRDAAFGSSLAQQIQSSTYPHGKRLSRGQRDAARRMMMKYAGQLAKIANRQL